MPRAKLPKYFWQFTALLVCVPSSLQRYLRSLAQDRGFSLYTAEPGSPDHFAVPCFCLIVDRNQLGHKAWLDFLEFRAEVMMPDSDSTQAQEAESGPDINMQPIFCIDGHTDAAAWPVDAATFVFDPTTWEGIADLLQAIKSAHRKANED